MNSLFCKHVPWTIILGKDQAFIIVPSTMAISLISSLIVMFLANTLMMLSLKSLLVTTMFTSLAGDRHVVVTSSSSVAYVSISERGKKEFLCLRCCVIVFHLN